MGSIQVRQDETQDIMNRILDSYMAIAEGYGVFDEKIYYFNKLLMYTGMKTWI